MLQDVAAIGRSSRLPGKSYFRDWHVADADELEAAFDAHAEAIQLSNGPFSAKLAQLRAGAASITLCAAQSGVQLRRRVNEGRLVVACSNEARTIFENGRPWTPQQLLIVSGRDVDMSSLDGAETLWIEVDLSLLESAEDRAVLQTALGRSVLLAPPRQLLDDLRSYAAIMLSVSAADPLLVKKTEFGLRVEAEVVRRLRSLLVTPNEGTVEVNRHRKAFSLVRRVERFMWENLEEPLTLERICANTNCRMRSLIYSFNDWFGIGPITYLKILRLNAVHRRLKETQGDVRIFDVAADFGFWHMGHFSTNYKRMFGVTPTQTISAARGPQNPVSA